MSRSTSAPVVRLQFLAPTERILPAAIRGGSAIAAVLLFGLIVARSTGMTSADLSVSQTLNAVHTGILGSVASAVYGIFSPAPAILITVVLAGLVWLVTRSWRHGVTFGVVVAAAWLPSAIVKVLVHRTRPDAVRLPHPFAMHLTDASYPSGHVVFVTALVATLFLLVRGHRTRPLVAGLGALLVALVTVALVVDGVHYVSDVLASIVWSLGLAPLILELWNRLVLPRTYRADRAVEVSV